MAKYAKASYSSMDNRRRMEDRDGSMLNEDQGAMANLPTEHFVTPFAQVEAASFDVQDSANSMMRRRSEDMKKQKDGKSVRRY